MKINYKALMLEEQEKLNFLLEKVEACKKRIDALNSLASSDSIDDAIEYELRSKKIVKNSSGQYKQGILDTNINANTKSLKSDILLLLEYLGETGKTLDQIEEFSQREKQIRKKPTRSYIRNIMMNLRKKNGYVDNTEPGFYTLTKAGIDYINSQKTR